MRSMVSDFTMLDFYNMVPKLSIQLREHVMNSTHSTGKSRASGYNHTYADTRGIDLSVLACFPSDNEIAHAADVAYGEAQGLMALIGVMPAHLSWVILPSVDTWMRGHDSDEETEDEEGESDELQQLFDSVENSVGMMSRSSETESELKNLSYAAIALSIGTSMAM